MIHEPPVPKRAQFEFWNLSWSDRIRVVVRAGVLEDKDPQKYPDEHARHQAWLQRLCADPRGEGCISSAYRKRTAQHAR